MIYSDKSLLLTGLNRWTGQDPQGVIALYNKYYDAYLDRARLIYGDTTVEDVTPASVNSTLRSRYIAQVMGLYKGRDQFIRINEQEFRTGVNTPDGELRVIVSPLGPRDMTAIAYTVMGDGMGINPTLDSHNYRCRVLGAVILQDSCWGTVFSAQGSDMEDGFRVDITSGRCSLNPTWNSGITEKSFLGGVEFYRREFPHPQFGYFNFHFTIRTTDMQMEYYDDRVAVVPTISASGRFQFLTTDDSSNVLEYDEVNTHLHAFPPTFCTVPVSDRGGRRSSDSIYNPRGNMDYQASLSRGSMYCTEKDYEALISALFLNITL